MQCICGALTCDLSLPEGERNHHVERSEAAPVYAAADWPVAVCCHLKERETATGRLFNLKNLNDNVHHRHAAPPTQEHPGKV